MRLSGLKEKILKNDFLDLLVVYLIGIGIYLILCKISEKLVGFDDYAMFGLPFVFVIGMLILKYAKTRVTLTKKEWFAGILRGFSYIGISVLTKSVLFPKFFFNLEVKLHGLHSSIYYTIVFSILGFVAYIVSCLISKYIIDPILKLE